MSAQIIGIAAYAYEEDGEYPPAFCARCDESHDAWTIPYAYRIEWRNPPVVVRYDDGSSVLCCTRCVGSLQISIASADQDRIAPRLSAVAGGGNASASVIAQTKTPGKALLSPGVIR